MSPTDQEMTDGYDDDRCERCIVKGASPATRTPIGEHQWGDLPDDIEPEDHSE